MEITNKQYAAVKKAAQDLQEAADVIINNWYGSRTTKREVVKSRAAVSRICKAFPEFAVGAETVEK